MLGRAVDALLGVGVDELSEDALEAELAGVDRQVRRLQMRSGELVAASAARQAARARAARPDDSRAPRRAERQSQRETSQRLGWTPGATKRALETARGLETLPEARQAARDGRLSTEHARVIADATRHFVGPQRQDVEAELVAAAANCNPVELRAIADRLVASRDPDAATHEATRRDNRRFFKAARTPDGDVRLSGLLAGLDAETLLTAIDAFRTQDVPGGTPRRPEVRSADALVAMARAALDHGTTGTAHGNRPHVTVVVDWSDLVAGTGCGEATWTGPIPARELRRLLDDAAISRVVTGPDSVPIDTGRATRNVGAGVWKALVARDGHCTFPGCDAPPSWCQAAHLHRRWIEGAGVSVGELALACHYHHRLVDRQKWRGHIVDGKVVWRPPGGRHPPPEQPDPGPGRKPSNATPDRRPGQSPTGSGQGRPASRDRARVAEPRSGDQDVSPAPPDRVRVTGSRPGGGRARPAVPDSARVQESRSGGDPARPEAADRVPEQPHRPAHPPRVAEPAAGLSEPGHGAAGSSEPGHGAAGSSEPGHGAAGSSEPEHGAAGSSERRSEVHARQLSFPATAPSSPRAQAFIRQTWGLVEGPSSADQDG